MKNLPKALFAQPTHRIQQRKRQTLALTQQPVLAVNQARKLPLNTTAQKSGARYEARVEKKLLQIARSLGCEFHTHTWFTVTQAGGNTKDVQPDFYLVFPSKATLLFEAKQTWVDTSEQLALYKQVLTKLGLGPITCCMICRNLTPETPKENIIRTFEDIREGSVWQLRI